MTDFERFGFGGRKLSVSGRPWLLTIDFEAFTPETADTWADAMRLWASASRRGGWRCSFFLAVEDAVRLRAADSRVWRGFAAAMRDLQDAGAQFYPHNHGVFDLATGLLAAHRPQRIPGYGKRASFMYDVVQRHQRDPAEWITQLLVAFDEIVVASGLVRPAQLAFRAGGWDHGDDREGMREYLNALESNRISFDSSASSGTFGSEDWRVGAPFGANVFEISPSLVEVAPCWALNCGEGVVSRNTATALLRLLRQRRLSLSRTATGAFVTVLHFDHLFTPARDGRGPAPEAVGWRVSQLFKALSALRIALNLESVTFDELLIER